MLILGLDPGTATVGYAILEKEKNKMRSVKYGCIRTCAGDPAGDRLVCIEKELIKIVKEYQPNEAAIEKLFFMKNLKTAIAVSQARGVMMLALAKKKLPTFEYTPLQVKLTVTGYGQAPKLQVQRMVKGILGLKELPQPDDAADALAIAICHACQLKIRRAIPGT
jgi:crossover junction endodeoxyribonuclease RuvC